MSTSSARSTVGGLSILPQVFVVSDAVSAVAINLANTGHAVLDARTLTAFKRLVTLNITGTPADGDLFLLEVVNRATGSPSIGRLAFNTTPAAGVPGFFATAGTDDAVPDPSASCVTYFTFRYDARYNRYGLVSRTVSQHLPSTDTFSSDTAEAKIGSQPQNRFRALTGGLAALKDENNALTKHVPASRPAYSSKLGAAVAYFEDESNQYNLNISYDGALWGEIASSTHSITLGGSGRKLEVAHAFGALQDTTARALVGSPDATDNLRRLDFTINAFTRQVTAVNLVDLGTSVGAVRRIVQRELIGTANFILATSTGIWRFSTGFGSAPVSLRSGDYNDIARAPDGRMMVAGDTEMAFTSTTAGSNPTFTGVTHPDVGEIQAVTYLRDIDGWLANVNFNLYLSTDNGTSWTNLGSHPLAPNSGVSLTAVAGYACLSCQNTSSNDAGLFVTADGVNWTTALSVNSGGGAVDWPGLVGGFYWVNNRLAALGASRDAAHGIGYTSLVPAGRYGFHDFDK